MGFPSSTAHTQLDTQLVSIDNIALEPVEPQYSRQTNKLALCTAVERKTSTSFPTTEIKI